MNTTEFLEEWRKFFFSTKGKIVGVTFQKADGSIRTMSARMGVYNPKNAPAPQGIVDRVEQDSIANTLTVYDMNADKKDNVHKGGYRRFRFDRLLSVRYQGKTYKVSA